MTYPENAPPRLTEQLAAELRSRAAEFGLIVTIRCRHCGAPLWDTQSVAAHAGPVCRRRHENDPGAHSAKNAATGAAETIPTT